MRHIIFVLLLIPSLALGAFTEFYCQSGGSNLNAGSTTNNSALYTSTGGNWVQSTRVFTPTDSTNPVSAGVTTGMWASVYVTSGATVATYIGKIFAVTNASNGTITIDGTFNTAVPPSNGTGTITIKVGGAWAGPNGSSGFPFSFAMNGGLKTATGDSTRINMSDAASYSITAIIGGSTNVGVLFQGYHTTPGDGFKATIDQGTTVAAIMNGGNSVRYQDLIFSSSATSGNSNGVSLTTGNDFLRCVVHGIRGVAINVAGQSWVAECEIYDFNKSNSASTPGISLQGGSVAVNNYIHDASAGTSCSGIGTSAGSGSAIMIGNIIDTLSGDGILVQSSSSSSSLDHIILNNTIYNCRNGIAVAASAGNYFLLIQNNILIKNSAYGFEGNTTFTTLAGEFLNNAYGSGTFANGSGDYHNTGAMILDNGTGNSTRVVIASNTSPFVAETTGNFSLNLASLEGTGRGTFTQTDGTNTGSVSFPDIGGVQANIGAPFPTPTPTPTVTPTPTPTPTPTEVSYGFPG